MAYCTGQQFFKIFSETIIPRKLIFGRNVPMVSPFEFDHMVPEFPTGQQEVQNCQK
jgi:hypothetical protein